MVPKVSGRAEVRIPELEAALCSSTMTLRVVTQRVVILSLGSQAAQVNKCVVSRATHRVGKALFQGSLLYPITDLFLNKRNAMSATHKKNGLKMGKDLNSGPELENF